MGLSTHELWLVLRARDEATRIVRNLTNGLVQAQTEGTSSQIRNLKQLMATEAAQYGARRAQLSNVIAGHGLVASTHKLEIDTIRNVMAATTTAYNLRRAEIMELTTTDRKARAQKLDALRTEYIETMAMHTATINGHKKIITATEQQALAVRGTALETKKAYDEQSADHAVQMANYQKALETEREIAAARQQTINGIRQVGNAAVTAGIGVAALGAGILYAMNIGVQAHREYQQAASLAYTQVDDKVNISLENVRNMGKVVASEIPAAFEQMQPALYDIFSSIEVRGKEAAGVGEEILRQAAKAAVAGQVDVQTAVQTSVGLLNGYGMKVDTVAEATANMNKVNDFMFTLVKEGVGGYEDFGAAVGKIIPSAQRAGVEMNDFGSVLALLTRNGATAANSGTFVSRALDAISKTKTQENFQKLGLSVRDASGQFKPFSQIMDEVTQKMETMSEPQKASFIEELFKGSGGTIQAMKAIIPALTNANGLYTELQASMDASAGSAEAAYQIMKATPEAQIQEMKNQWSILSETVGKAAMPAFLAITNIIGDLAAWFNNLSPSTQTLIVNLGIAAGVFSIIMGIVLILGGGLMILVSGLMAIGVAATAGAAAGMIAGFIGIAAIIGVVIALVVAFWPQISAAAQSAFNAVIEFVQGFVGAFMEKFAFFQPFFAEMGSIFTGIWDLIVKTINDVANSPAIQEFVGSVTAMAGDIGAKLSELGDMFQQFGGALANIFSTIGLVIGTFVMMVWGILSPFITAIGSGLVAGFMALWAGIQVVFSGIVTFITGILQVLTGLFTGNWQMMVDGVKNIIDGFVNVVVGLLTGLVGGIMGLIGGFIGGFIAFFVNLYDVLVGNSIIPDMVNAIIEWIASLPGAIFATLAGLVSGAIAKFNEMKAQAVEVFNIMVLMVIAKIVGWIRDMDDKVSQLPQLLTSALGPLGGMIANVATTAWNMFKTAVRAGIDIVLAIVRGNPAQIVAALGNVGTLLLGAGKAIMKGFADGLKASWKLVTDFVGGIAAWIKNNKGPLDYDYKLLQPAGNAIMSGFGDALNNGFSTVQSSVATMGARLVTSATSNAMSQAAMFKDVGIISGKNLVSGLLSMESQVAGAAGRMNAAIAMDTALNNGSVVSNGAGLSGATVNVDVHTQEIDPVKNAADLGHEISSRLGSW